MTILTLVTLSLSLLALSISTYALIVARRSSDRSLATRSNEHSQRLSELVEQQEALSLALRNLRARVSMQLGRAKKANGETQPEAEAPTLSIEDEKDRWTRETNVKLALGQLRMR